MRGVAALGLVAEAGPFLQAARVGLGLAFLVLVGFAQAAPTLPLPLAQVLRQLPPPAAPSSATAASSATPQTCAPMCVVPMKGQSVQQAINAIEQAGHCSISNPPGVCKPTSATYWSTMQLSAQGLQTLERLEGWSKQNNPAKGEIPGVCYDDSAGHGTVGYGHEYRGGHSCAWLMNHPNTHAGAQYQQFKLHPLTKGSPAAIQLLQGDVQGKAVTPITKHVKAQLSQQQFDALVIWVFNVGGGKKGLLQSNALKNMNTCQLNAVPSDFTHYDHANGQVSCGLYRRDMVSGEIWVSGAYTVPRDSFPCPKDSSQ